MSPIPPPLRLAWTAWTEDSDGSRDTADPLGLRAVATAIARELVPGLTQRTHLVRGFSVLATGLFYAKGQPSNAQKEAFLRFERLWVAANVQRYRQRTPFAGGRRGAILLKLGDDYPLDRPILTSQLSSGVWGTYRGSAASFGLITARRYSDPANTLLNNQGEALAKASRLFDDSFPVWDYVAPGGPAVGHDDLEEALSAHDSRLPTNAEQEVLTDAVRPFDARRHHRLHDLHSAWVKGERSPLNVTQLVPGDLAVQHGEIAAAAQAADRLLSDIERPYREWVTGGTATIPRSIWSSTAWDRVQGWPGSLPLLRLRSLGRAASDDAVMAAVHRHHRDLSRARGSTAWEQGVTSPERADFVPYDFCLGALSQLFEQGIAP